MAKHVEISPDDFTTSPFKAIGKGWMLIAASRGGRTNAMTASWGGLGVMWGRNVAFAVIRPQRYTREFVDGSATFSLNFLPEAHRETLTYFGKVSGRDEDKIAKTGLTVLERDGTPYFAEAGTALLCRKLFAQPYAPGSFIDPDIEREWYPDKDHHTLYIAEVLRILGE